jgi:hypothetical protein
LIFNIINTNKNRTATAPTYTTKKAIGKNSKLNKKANADTLKNEKIKNKTENIGFFVHTTKVADVKQKAENNKKRLDFISIYKKKLLLNCFFHTVQASLCFSI